MLMRNVFALFAACVTLLAFASLPATADVGPCRPDSHHGLICGEGDGAARVIVENHVAFEAISLGLRSTDYPPTESAEGDDSLELLLIRLKDGAVLSRRKTDYWDTGETHVNRLYEIATWSPESRWMINTTQERFNSSTVDLYAFGNADRPTGPFDLLKIMEGAARAQLKKRVQDDSAYEFSLDSTHLRIDDRGLLRATATLWVPKRGPEQDYDMTLQVTQNGGRLGAKLLSIRAVPPKG
jgi:hypothetical protein